MSRRGTAASVLLILVAGAVLGAPGAAAARRAKTHVVPVERYASAFATGTNGWHAQVYTKLPRTSGRRRLSVTLNRSKGEIVTYQVLGRATGDGRIDAKLPGIGRIDLDFVQTREAKGGFQPPTGCTSSGTDATRTGYFRGVIRIHGEGGFTTVARRNAHGVISESPREVCKERQTKTPVKHPTPALPASVRSLGAGHSAHGGELAFAAVGYAGYEPADEATQFAASYSHTRRGMVISAYVIAVAGPTAFSLPAGSGTPTEATVEPPAPFIGSATFRLESPEQSSWTGDLSVEMPTLGTVSLAGPGFWSGLCARGSCTKTFPPDVEIELQTIR
jgi:hypothetical protein